MASPNAGPRIALFRAVNVSGANKVAMADLKAMFEDLGLGPARTLQAAGSVVFHGPGADAALEVLLESEAASRLGLKSPVFVRDPAQWDAIIAHNPYPDAARDAPNRLMVTPLKGRPTPEGVAALQACARHGEQIAAWEACAYFHYVGGVADSKLTPKLIERCLGHSGTARNWNTTLKLAAMMAEG